MWRVGPDDQIWSREVQAIVDLRDDLRALLAPKAKQIPRPGDDPRTTDGAAIAAAKANKFRQLQAARAAQRDRPTQ
mgnify:CR=1 FL=1